MKKALLLVIVFFNITFSFSHDKDSVALEKNWTTKGKISFISPMAKILINRKIGDKVTLKLAKQDRVFEIMDIAYIQ